MSFVSDVLSGITGETAAEGATDAAATNLQGTREAIAATQAAAQEGQQFLAPYAGVGQQGLDQTNFLTDPQAQFDFLQSNPLFQLSLDNANASTNNMAAARGRLSAGDTLQQLSNNVLLSSQPLIAEQKRSIGDLLNFGSGIAQSQANTAIGTGTNVGNLITSGASSTAAGQVAAANAATAGASNVLSSGLLAGGLLL